MATTTGRAQIIRVRVEEGKTGLFFATSPDLKGLLVAEPTIDELEATIPQAIAELWDATYGDKVVVTKAKDNDPQFYPWVALPLAVARRVAAEAAS